MGHLIAEHFADRKNKSTFCAEIAGVIAVAYYATIALSLHQFSGNGRKFRHEVEADGSHTFTHVYTAFIGTRIGYFDYKGTRFLGGLSLHLNHLIESCMANYDWQFGTLPFGIFESNLDTMGLETYPRTYSGQF